MAGKRLYTCNYRYFQNIDSEEKAYWLGFIMADGHIFETYKGNRPNPARGLKITLSVVDKDHLYKFRDCMDSNHPIRTYSRKGSNDYCRIVINDSNLYYDLVNLGAIPNKTFKVKFPNIEEKYYKHYIRGLWDGDGGFSVKTRKSTLKVVYDKWYLTSTLESLKVIEGYICQQLNLPFKSHYQKRWKDRDDNIYRLQYSSSNCGRVLKLLYSDCSIYLERKYRKYQSLNNGRS